MSLELADHAFLRDLLGGDGLSGPGDDAAAFRARGAVLATIDPVIEGRHVAPGTSARKIGRKLVHRSFSDLAAMGAWPDAVLVSCCFGRGWPTRRRRDLYRGILAAVLPTGAGWIGGDIATCDGPSVWTLCALGHACASRPVRRSGLCAGDRLFVTGALGGSLASGWHLDFEPRLEWGKRIAREHRPSAMLDVSDGLSLDLARLLAASGRLGAVLDAEAIPIRRGSDLRGALGDGEDYELLFGLRRSRCARLAVDPSLPPIARRPIGEVVAKPGLRLRRADGSLERLAPRGFEHDLD